jgi:hypothetical protein
MQNYDIQTRRGDTFGGVKFIFSLNGSPVSLLGCDILMQVRQEADAQNIIMQFSTADSEITIGGVDNNEVTILPKVVPANAPARKCAYDVQITFPDSTIKTWVTGEFEILKDVTR